jgi:transposase-like protein
MAGMKAWQGAPSDGIYPIVYQDALLVKGTQQWQSGEPLLTTKL